MSVAVNGLKVLMIKTPNNTANKNAPRKTWLQCLRRISMAAHTRSTAPTTLSINNKLVFTIDRGLAARDATITLCAV